MGAEGFMKKCSGFKLVGVMFYLSAYLRIGLKVQKPTTDYTDYIDYANYTEKE